MHKDQDQDIEEFVPEDGEGNTQSQVARLKEKLKAAEEKAKEYLDNWQRAQADFVNLRKKDEEEIKIREKYAAASFLREIIPVIQSLEKAAESDEHSRAIISQFQSVLKKIGVKEIVPNAGDKFDPNIYEAIKVLPTDEEARDHLVAELLEKGYLLHDRVVRPAKVAVYSHN